MGSFTLFSCDPFEPEISTNPNHKLRFSADTVLFDTLLSSVGSVTKRFRIYNDAEQPVEISKISTGQVASQFTVTLNGITANSFQDVRLLANDSTLMLVTTFIDPQDEDLPYIVSDNIQFETNGNLQWVELVAWGQDANFINQEVISINTTWSSQRPYIIYDFLFVDTLTTLTIDPGVNILAHNGASIYILGNVQAQGTTDEPIRITSSRTDINYENAPGQWEGIYFLEGSSGSIFDHAEIRNARFGFWLGTPDDDTDPDLTLTNSRIENMSEIGLVAFTSDLVMSNTLIDNCGQYCLANFAGGNYSYSHNTLTNPGIDFFHDQPTAVFSDFYDTGQGILYEPLSLFLENSIIWGNLQNEIAFAFQDETASSTEIENNLLKTTGAFSASNILNINPKFISPQSYNYRLDSLSPAINQARSSLILEDIVGTIRLDSADIGAYEWKPDN